MKKIILFAAFFLLVFVHEGFAFIQLKGAYDNSKKTFYFTGHANYIWSHRKKEFKGKQKFIYKYNIAKRKKNELFSSDCNFTKLNISPNNNYLSALCKYKNGNKSLIVINTKGEKLLEISDSVQGHAWHPDSNKLIYMTGKKKYRGDSDEILSSGIWLYDIEKKNKKKIADKGWNVRNVSFDKHIYFWNGKKTVRYNVDNEKIEETNIKERVGASRTEYSPNGRYYTYGDLFGQQSWGKPYWGPLRIYDTKENKDLPPEKVVFMTERNAGKEVWGKDSRIIAFEGNISRTDGKRALYFYDLETSKVLKQFKGKIVGFDKDRTVLVIYRDGEFYLEKFPY